MSYNTGNPVPSNYVCDLSDNIENADVWSNSLALTAPDRFGVQRSTFEGVRQGLGFYNVGTFASGATLTNTRQVLTHSDGHEYGWSGAFPKVVAAGSSPTPLGAGGWVDRSDASLRSELVSSSGGSLVGLHTGSFAKLSDLVSAISSTVTPGGIPVFGDTSGVATLNIPDNPASRLFVNKVCTNADDFSVIQVARHANYSGGTSGYVGTAFQAKTYVEATATATSEWVGLFQLDNNAPNNPIGTGPGSGALPQNVAVYGQAQKRGTGSTWAGCFEINDYLNGANGAAIGIEVACSTEGADVFATPQRNGVHVAIGELVAGGTASEWGRGFWVSTGSNTRSIYGFAMTGIVGDSVFNSAATTTQAAGALLRDTGSLVMGIDLTGAAYSSSMAIRLKVGLKIGFNDINSYYLMGNDSVGGIICNGVFQMQNSFSMPSHGNISTTATAGTRTLPVSPSGFINAKLDGASIRIPYYGA